MKPDFLCIGAQKAGTTWLYTMLQQHPEFQLPPIKEIHYFDRQSHYPSPSHLNSLSRIRRVRKAGFVKFAISDITHSLVEGSYSEILWKIRYYYGNHDDAWYLRLFSRMHGITGDVTPAYSILELDDISAMATLLPNVKIVFLIRNPLDRAWSMFRFRKQFEPNRDLTDFEGFKAFIDSPNQSLRSNYIQTIDRYLCHFRRENILIGFYDAISEQPLALLHSIFRHVGATNLSHKLDYELVINPSQEATIPPIFESYLRTHYESQLKELAHRFGSYACLWLSQSFPDHETPRDDLQPSFHP